MKKLLLLLFVSSLFMLTACEQKCDVDLETNKIEMVLERYVIANETKDIDLVHQIWASDEDIVVFGTDSDEKLIGWDAIKTAVLAQFETFEDVFISTSDQIINVNCSGNTAWFSEIIDYNYTFEDKAYTYEGIRFTGILEKRNEEWLIVQSHMSIPASAQ